MKADFERVKGAAESSQSIGVTANAGIAWACW